MTTQIAVRLPDDVVAYVDAQVSAGEATSRAAVVTSAIERMRRADAAARDATIYERLVTTGDDLDPAADWAANQPIDLD